MLPRSIILVLLQAHRQALGKALLATPRNVETTDRHKVGLTDAIIL